jgi:regulator of RNase E activity RraA
MRCEVNVFGMLASDDDVIHADFHGAVVIPATAVKQLPEAIELVGRREKVILEMARSPDFNSARMHEALKRVNQIH